jgi:hypothetical protein
LWSFNPKGNRHGHLRSFAGAAVQLEFAARLLRALAHSDDPEVTLRFRMDGLSVEADSIVTQFQTNF